MLRIKPIFFLLLLFGLTLIPQAHAETITQTRYWNSSFWIINNYFQSGTTFQPKCPYRMESLATTNVEERGELSYTVNATMYAGIRVYILFPYGNKTEISNGVPVAQASVVWSGFSDVKVVHGYFDFPLTNVSRGDAILVEAYGKTNSTAWALFSTKLVKYGWYSRFVTEGLGALRIIASTWDVVYYIGVSFVDKLYEDLEWGRADSRIENIQFDNGITTVSGLSFSSGVVIAGVIAGLVIIVVGAVGMDKKRRR